MPRWTCPRCDREFARARTAHVCVPGCTVDEVFTGKPESLRAAYDLIVDLVRTLGPVHEDAVRVGVFLKAESKFAELRPSSRSLSVALALPRVVDDPRLRRPHPASGGRTWHVTRVRSAGEVDGPLRDWLAQAYDAAG